MEAGTMFIVQTFRRRPSFSARALALAMVVAAVVNTGGAFGSPGDLFSSAAPALGTDAPKAADIHVGDASVSATGALTWGYSIAVPPGRNGMQPHLSLTYSSQAPIYGGIAAGWAMDLPMITDDSNVTRIKREVSTTPEAFVSTLSNGRRLVQITESFQTDPVVARTYRANGDDAYLRYEQMNSSSAFRWRALALDGTTYEFGDAYYANCPNSGTGIGFAPLTGVVDAFGNRVSYYWNENSISANSYQTSDCRIDRITYGSNPGAGFKSDFATVKFNYVDAGSCSTSPAVPIGSQIDWRQGIQRVTGGVKLASIVVTANDPGTPATPLHTRQITLGYDTSTETCATHYAAYRQLTSIQESAWLPGSTHVDLPPVAFTYGPATLSYQAPIQGTRPWSLGDHNQGNLIADNLSWGYRTLGPENGTQTWPTVEGMMVDVDGDGLVDRVYNDPVLGTTGSAANRVVSCRARWERNQGVDPSTGVQLSFDATPARYIPLPTLKWANAPATTAGQGSGFTQGGTIDYGYAAFNSLAQIQEGCALNFQLTTYTNSHAGGGACGEGTTCPASGTCSNHNDCTSSFASGTPATYLSYRWMDYNNDGLVDVVSAVLGQLSDYNLLQGNNVGSLAEPQILTPFPACPVQPFPRPSGNGYYTMCGGMAPWMPMKNTGGGLFTQMTPIYQPAALEPDTADSAIVGGTPMGSLSGTLDFDGDGNLDAIAGFVGTGGSSAQWEIYLGDGKGLGQLLPALFGTPSLSYVFNTIVSDQLSQTSFTAGSASPTQVQGLFDLNGDGLLDHWSGSGGAPNVAINDGLQFRRPTGAGEITASAKPATDANGNVRASIGTGSLYYITNGYRSDRARTVDVDGDGRVDVVTFPNGPTSIDQVQFNEGGQFGPATTAGDSASLAHWMVASNLIPFYPPNGTQAYTWAVRSDQIDLDGDGIPEGVSFGSGDTPGTAVTADVMMIAKIATPVSPPRLLSKIDNGHGAATTITYASMHNTNVVNQHPELNQASPRNTWVVKNMSTYDMFSNTTTATTHQYFDPVFSKDDQGRYAFRGFDEIWTTSQSGAKTVARYGFDIDWSGRQTSILVSPAPSEGIPGEVRSIEDTTWSAQNMTWGLGGVAVYTSTYLPLYADRWVCKNGQDEAACRANTDTHTRTTSLYTTYNDVVAKVGTRLQTDFRSVTAADVIGDRSTHTTYAFNSAANAYRLRSTDAYAQLQAASGPIKFTHSAKTWDSSLSVPLTIETWVDGVDASRSVERMVYDMTTGNVTQRWKPEQNAANTFPTIYTYDSRKLFVIAEIREPAGYPTASMEIDYTYDYGTGAKLLTQGPNVRNCTTDCINDAAHPAKQTQQSIVDGLGREIEHWITFANDNDTNYVLYQVATTAYTDSIIAGAPASVLTKHLVDTAANTARVQARTDFDGLGRPFRQTSFTQGTAPADAVTTTHFNNDGTVHDVTVPNPSANDASTVMVSYSFDSLGRATSIRRPDNATPANQSGLNVSYNGLSTTNLEIVQAGDGKAASTTVQRDVFGRTAEVYESLGSGAPARTLYVYDAADNVSQVTDPEGVVTSMTHDLAGHRTAITRSGRTWEYTYDRNGNVIATVMPGWATMLDKPRFTSTTSYDNLDRPVSRAIAPLNLSAADLALFGAGTETYTWDYGWSHKGTLRYSQSFAPSSSTPSILVDSYNDANGNSDVWNHTYNFAGYTALRNQFSSETFITGAQHFVKWHNFFGADYTWGQFFYDLRGLPSKISYYNTDTGSVRDIAVQTRNVAGLVTKRHTDTVGGAMTSVESNWNYDALGRVTSQVVQEAPTLQVARQDLAYFGNDDPKTLDHYLGATNHKHFTYGYDYRHQITSVAESASAFSATYGYGTAGRFNTALEAAAALPGTDVKARNVAYHYAGTDTEEVTSLSNEATGAGHAPYATYTYDASGNQLTRCLGPVTTPTCTGEEQDFVYDGKDQLRRVTKKLNGVVQGSEEYWYDNQGGRVAIVKRDASGSKTELVSFNHSTEAHYDATGALQHFYGYLTLGTPVARVDRSGSTTSNTEFQFQGLGDSTLATVDNSGTINASFDYAPFGELIEATDGGSASSEGVGAHRRRMNGKYFDDISDLGYYGARYYDKTSITWTQGDPLYRFVPDLGKSGAPRRANLYTYTLNNSLRYSDPDGLDADQHHWSNDEIIGADRAGRESESEWADDHRVHANGTTWSSGASSNLGPDSNGNCRGVWSGCINEESIGAAIFRFWATADLKAASGIDWAIDKLYAAAGAQRNSGDAFDLLMVDTGAGEVLEGTVELSEAADIGTSANKLVHYTSESGLAGILKSGEINASEGAVYARYGTGQYLTDIAPEMVGGVSIATTPDGLMSLGQLSRRLWGMPHNLEKVSHFVEIDVTGLACRLVNRNIFLIDNTSALDVSSRILRSGATLP